ncbi:MAG: Gfo/Idh/MocA family oxidoreductase [Chloroflexi bacterium]|nr:Gfo/Idh/MocA family oxidoreductase [Chloroflexota bacterium]
MPTTNDAIGVGVIGAGLVGPTHAEAAARAPGGQLIAVCDLVAERAEAVAEQHGAIPLTEVDALLERRDIQIVSICLPTRLHLDVAERAVAAGKHIIVEKPLELSLERADRLLQAARKNNVQVAAIFNRRYIPALKATKRAVEEGLLGDLIAADMYYKSFRTQEYYDDSGWRGTWEVEGGAALINQGIHGVDLLRWVAGAVARVFGYTDHLRRAIEADDTTAAVARYANGAMGVIQAMTSIEPRLPDRLEYHGTKGSIQLANYRISSWSVPGAESWPDAVVAEEETLLASTRSLESAGHHAQIAEIVAAIRDGRPPAVTGEEGRRSLEVVLAIYESARTGREVSIPA